MAAEDTILGRIQYCIERLNGDVDVLLSGLDSDLLDKDTSRVCYINPNPKFSRAATDEVFAMKAVFKPGEKLLVQHKANATAEACGYDHDQIECGIIKTDLNNGRKWHESLRVADTTLTANYTTSTTAWVTMFSYTCPNNVSFTVNGKQRMSATEHA